jgi:hypothetical protein
MPLQMLERDRAGVKRDSGLGSQTGNLQLRILQRITCDPSRCSCYPKVKLVSAGP